jgi:DNA-directed RNA polymerase specialized sigma24 family protein
MERERRANSDSAVNGPQRKTLGDILYSDGTKTVATEKDCVRLLRWIEADDPVALHALYRMTHRIVFTLIFRITNDWEAAEQQTIEVFQDIRRDPRSFDSLRGSVVGWIAHKARATALRGRSTADPHTLYNLLDATNLLREALRELTTEELQAIETAFFSESSCEEVADTIKVPAATVMARIRAGLRKLRRLLGPPSRPNFVHSPTHLDSVYLYVLQALSPKDMLSVERQISACEDCTREVSSLRPVIQSFVCWQTDLLRPATSLWRRLAQKIGEETGNQPMLAPPDLGQNPLWQDVATGISCKLLATDTDKSRVSMLVRLAPGTDYPPHRHAGLEELYLLHGELIINETKIYPGYYCRAQAGSEDYLVWTQTGCSCLLLTSTQDVILSAL